MSASWFTRLRSAAAERAPDTWAWASLGVVPAILFGFNLVAPIHVEHYLMALLFLVLTWTGPRARQFALLGGVFALVALTYNLLGVLNPLRGEVHVADLWRWEHRLFPGPGGRSLSDWLSSVSHPVVDALAGLTYINHLSESLALAAWFFVWGDTQRSQRLALTFAITNVAGWVVWLVWPAAPPWYVDSYGLGPAVLDAAPSAAGALRVDELLGFPLFAGFYAKNTNIFGAMPSLHCCYTVSCALLGFGFGRGTRIFTFSFSAVMLFSAVYLRHHYILDVIAGVSLAVLVHLALAPLFSRPAAPGAGLSAAAPPSGERDEMGSSR